MNTNHDADVLRDLPAATEADLAALHARLTERAAADGVLDVAYRTLDTPVGTLLLAATEAGLVRVAFPIEGHDEVLQALAARISPGCCAHPAGSTPQRTRSTSTSPACAAASTCRSTTASPRGSAVRC
jgi:hypothetical protein